MAAPYRSREGLSTRPAAYGGNSDEVQVRIEPDLDDHVTGLRKQVRLIRDVAKDINREATFQNDFLNQLQTTMTKAQEGVKNNMRETEQEHHLGRIEPCHACRSFCAIVVFLCLLLVQILQKMKDTSNVFVCSHN